MRPFECEITDQYRSELLENLLQRGDKLTIKRTKEENGFCEDWKFGNDWFRLFRAENEDSWRVLFGTGIIGKNQLEDTIEWFESRTEIRWVWPPEGINELYNQAGDDNSE
jgi:hypothetical protein